MEATRDQSVVLGPDIMQEIFANLPVRSYGRMSQVCKDWNRVLKESDRIWRRRFREDFVQGARGGREKLLQNCSSAFMNSSLKIHAREAYMQQLAARTVTDPLVFELEGPSGGIWDVCPVGIDMAVTCTEKGSVQSWNVQYDQLRLMNERLIVPSGAALTDIVVDESLSYAVTCGLDSNFYLIDLLQRKVVKTCDSDLTLKMARSGNLVVTSSPGPTVRIYKGLFDRDPNVELETIPLVGHTDWVRSVCVIEKRGSGTSQLNPGYGGDLALSGADDYYVALFDLESAQLLGRMSAQPSQVHSVAASFDGGIGASGNSTGTVDLWDLKSHNQVGAMEKSSENIHALSFCPDGVTLLAGSDRGLSTWDLRNLKELKRFESEITSVRFSEAGELLFVCSGRRLLCSQLDKLDF
ncbi:hypothetical protein NDN08_004767 [Rhodosorus marinus]|uniref:F-box domain-containing protein n=1 Tax=Rhodosorus marinus TaxID=101924 RepID=A0AAV8UM84_9RHOD|nr:hypothetical protein NDN08_004767 [Rhodosorus marinus]